MSAAPVGAIFRGALAARKLPLAIWAASVAAVCALYGGLYPTLEKIDLDEMVKAMPPALVEMLGYEDMVSAAGYFGSAIHGLVGFFLLIIFAIMNGAALIVGEEQSGALELELTSPIPRTRIFLERLLSLWAQTAVLSAVVWIVLALVNVIASLEVDQGDLFAASFNLFWIATLFGTLALSVGAATGRRALSLGSAVGSLVVSWMMNALGPMAGADWLATLSPVGWFMADNPVIRGFDAGDLALLVTTTMLLALIGWAGFKRRDLMIA